MGWGGGGCNAARGLISREIKFYNAVKILLFLRILQVVRIEITDTFVNSLSDKTKISG